MVETTRGDNRYTLDGQNCLSTDDAAEQIGISAKYVKYAKAFIDSGPYAADLIKLIHVVTPTTRSSAASG